MKNKIVRLGISTTAYSTKSWLVKDNSTNKVIKGKMAGYPVRGEPVVPPSAPGSMNRELKVGDLVNN